MLSRVSSVIQSMVHQEPPMPINEYEIIIAGLHHDDFANVTSGFADVQFKFVNATGMAMTTKMNAALTVTAKDVVFMVHDYVGVNKGFAAAINSYKPAWDVASVECLVQLDGTKRASRVIHKYSPDAWTQQEVPGMVSQPYHLPKSLRSEWTKGLPDGFTFVPEYLELSIAGSTMAYQPGQAVLAKRTVFQNYPYVENCYWGCLPSEDVTWGYTVHQNHRLHIIPGARGVFVKEHAPLEGAPMSQQNIDAFIQRGLAWAPNHRNRPIPRDVSKAPFHKTTVIATVLFAAVVSIAMLVTLVKRLTSFEAAAQKYTKFWDRDEL